MTERQPFAKSWHRRRASRIEFDSFLEHAETAIRAAAEDVPGIETLDKNFGFDVEVTSPETVQAWFYNRFMGRQDEKGKLLSESGAYLLYSLGPTGYVSVSLCPCMSEVAKWGEQQLFIGLGRFSAYQLRMRLKSDLRALAAYGFVTSLDAEPTWGEWLRVWWLRRTKPSQVDGKFVAGGSTLVGATLKAAYRSALLGAFTAVMRPVGYVIVALVLAHFGKAAWIDFFRAK